MIVPASKYRAKPVTIDGVRFASMREGRRYSDLVLLARSGAIRDLQVQPRFPIDVVELFRGLMQATVVRRCGFYTADFQYIDTATGELIVEDVKSGPTRTTSYRLRKRLVEAIHGIRIYEV